MKRQAIAVLLFLAPAAALAGPTVTFQGGSNARTEVSATVHSFDEHFSIAAAGSLTHSGTGPVTLPDGTQTFEVLHGRGLGADLVGTVNLGHGFKFLSSAGARFMSEEQAFGAGWKTRTVGRATVGLAYEVGEFVDVVLQAERFYGSRVLVGLAFTF